MPMPASASMLFLLFMPFLGSDVALGQRAPWVSPAWQCSLGNPCLHHGGRSKCSHMMWEMPILSWERCCHSCRQLLSGQTLWRGFTQLCSANTCPSSSSQLLLFSTWLQYPAALGQLGSAPQTGRRWKRQLESHTTLFIHIPSAQATRSGGSPADYSSKVSKKPG